MSEKIKAHHLERGTYVYVRQSTPYQVRNHLEGQQRQYALRERAKQLGFRNIVVIDEDLGRSGSGIGNCLWDSSALQRDGSRRLPNHACAQRGPD